MSDVNDAMLEAAEKGFPLPNTNANGNQLDKEAPGISIPRLLRLSDVEAEEVRWYEAVTGLELDEATLVVLGEILDSERHHLRDLRGKWMSA